jgi:hypothetical protein
MSAKTPEKPAAYGARRVSGWIDYPALRPENTCSGPVAQLGARFHGMEEVIGSIPIRSTK